MFEALGFIVGAGIMFLLMKYLIFETLDKIIKQYKIWKKKEKCKGAINK